MHGIHDDHAAYVKVRQMRQFSPATRMRTNKGITLCLTGAPCILLRVLHLLSMSTGTKVCDRHKQTDRYSCNSYLPCFSDAFAVALSTFPIQQRVQKKVRLWEPNPPSLAAPRRSLAPLALASPQIRSCASLGIYWHEAVRWLA